MGIDNLRIIKDERGTLAPIELNSFYFSVKRIFYVTDVPTGETRGCHSHYKTKQYLICIKGVIEVILHDGKKETITTLKQNEGLLIPELIWDSQKFITKDAVLLVLCSTPYDINDYILDFDEFLKITK